MLTGLGAAVSHCRAAIGDGERLVTHAEVERMPQQDPHFKAQNHRRRIISLSLLAEYAYLLAPGGRMYTITDVPELAEWMRSKVAAHPSFRPLTPEEMEADVAAGLLITSSEEGQKVERNMGQVRILAHLLWL